MATDPQDFIDTIINNAIELADNSSAAAAENADLIVDLATGFRSSRTSFGTLPIPEALEPDMWDADGNLSLQTYNAYVDYLIGQLSGKLADFFNTYMPLTTDAWDEANAWLVDVITNGGTGIPTAVEDQIWQRDRDRVIREGGSAQDTILNAGAALGHPKIQGSIASDLKEVIIKRLEVTGQQSTSVAIKQAEIEIETIKFAIEKALETRKIAMNAAMDYLRAIGTTFNPAIGVANLDGDKRAQMMSAVADLYRARLARDELIINSSVTERGQKVSHWADRETSWNKRFDIKVNAAASSADVYAKIAQAALASLNTITSTAVSAFG